MEFLNLLFVIILHLSFATTGGSKIPMECPELVRGKGHYSAVHAGKCYMFVNKEVYWNEASGDCLQMGGDLVTIINGGIMDFLKYQLDTKVPWRKRGVWIGARYYDDRGWKWSTGEDVSGGYTYWAKGESKKFLNLFKIEKCTLMRREDNWQWHDYHCGAFKFHYNYICQFPTVVVTTPPTTESAPTVSEEAPVLIVRQIDLLRPSHYVVEAVAHSYQENGHSAHTSSSGNSTDNGNMSILLIVIGLAGLVIFTMLVIFFIYRKRQRDKHNLHDPRVRYENRTYGPIGQNERYRLEDDDNNCSRPVSNVYMSPVDVNTLYEEVQKEAVNHGVNAYKDSNLNCVAPPPPPPPRSDSASSVCEGAVGGAEATDGESPSSICKVNVGETPPNDYIELDESTDPLIKSIYLTPKPEIDVKEGNLYVDMNGAAKTSNVEVDPLEKEKKDNLLNEHVYSNSLEKKAENDYEVVPERP